MMHVELPLVGGHVLMGTDAPESMGFSATPGSNISINLESDMRAEARRLVDALAAGASIEMPQREMFRDGYFASFVDRFGILWRLNCASKS